MSTVPVEKYLLHAIRFSPEELKLKDSFTEWLPDDIIDAHAHCNLAEHVHSIGEKSLVHMLSTFTHYSLEDSRWVRETFFHPGKRVRTLRFAKTFRGIDHKVANEYLLSASPEEDRIALFGLPEDVEYTVRMLSHPRVSALKMYYSYVEPTAETIYDYFRPDILEEAQRLDKPIILHLPKMIVRCTDDLLRVLSDFPRLRVVLAHLGLSKMVVPGLENAFELVAPYQRVLMDTALNPSAEVVALAFKHFGTERIMYGSDEPLHLIRSVPYVHPDKGERIVTDIPYHWADQNDHQRYGHLARNAVHAHWLALGAIRAAIEQLSPHEQKQARDGVFYKNACAFFGF